MPPVREGKVFKLKSGSWAYRTHRGRGGQVGGFRTKGEARAACDEALARERAGATYRPTMTFAELCDEFEAQYDPPSPNTKRVTLDRLKPAKRAFGRTPIEKLSARDVAAWRPTLPEASRWPYHKALSQVLNYAVRMGLLDRNVAKDVPNPEPHREEVLPFETWADIEEVAANLPPHLRAIPVFAAGTGLRPTEWIPLTRDDVDLAAGVVHVRRRYAKGILTPAPAKGKGARRRVPLRGVVVDVLREWPMPVARDGLIFPAERGGLLDLHYFRAKPWAAAIEGAGIDPPRTPYALRHTYATFQLAAGVNIHDLARRMGTSVSQIDKTYGHLAPDAEDVERGLMNEFDRRLSEAERREQAK